MSSNAVCLTLIPWPISKFQAPSGVNCCHNSNQIYSPTFTADQKTSVGTTELFFSVCCTVFQCTFDLIAFLFDKYDFDPVMIALFAAIIFKKDAFLTEKFASISFQVMTITPRGGGLFDPLHGIPYRIKLGKRQA